MTIISCFLSIKYLKSAILLIIFVLKNCLEAENSSIVGGAWSNDIFPSFIFCSKNPVFLWCPCIMLESVSTFSPVCNALRNYLPARTILPKIIILKVSSFFSGLVTKILEMFSHYDNFFNHGSFLLRLDCIYTENLYFNI